MKVVSGRQDSSKQQRYRLRLVRMGYEFSIDILWNVLDERDGDPDDSACL